MLYILPSCELPDGFSQHEPDCLPIGIDVTEYPSKWMSLNALLNANQNGYHWMPHWMPKGMAVTDCQSDRMPVGMYDTDCHCNISMRLTLQVFVQQTMMLIICMQII